MKIYFCDICNESVPQTDLDRGRAFLRKGRVVCASCDRAMSVHTPGALAGAVAAEATDGPGADGARTPLAAGEGAVAAHPAAASAGAPPPHAHATSSHPAPPQGGALATVLAAMAIVVVAAVAVLLFERMDASGRRAEQDLRELRAELVGDLRAVEASLELARTSGADEQGRLSAGLAELRARQEERDRSRDELLGRLRDDLDAVALRLDEVAARLDDAGRAQEEVGRLAGRLGEVRADLGLVADRLLALEERGAAPPPAEPSSPGQPDPAAPEAPAWADSLERLGSASSSDRWTAVQELADTKDPAVVEHLGPMLADPDIFVRMATARVLGELGAATAIPALIDALEDPEPSVRETAAASLRSLAGRSFDFDPDAPESQRAKKVKAWRDWWKREADDLLGGS